MSKIIFSKIIELEQCQVLVTKDYDDEEGKPQLVISTHIDGGVPTIKMGFSDTDKRDDAFNQYNETSAQSFYERMKLFFE